MTANAFPAHHIRLKAVDTNRSFTVNDERRLYSNWSFPETLENKQKQKGQHMTGRELTKDMSSTYLSYITV